MNETTRYKFQFPPGQEPELVPEEKAALFERFGSAFKEWTDALAKPVATVDVFYAGYMAGYGHAKDDVQQFVEKQA